MNADRRQSVHLDIEATRNTITFDGEQEHVYQVLDAPKPEEFELRFDSDGNVIGCTYKGYNSRAALEYLKESKRFRLSANQMHGLFIVGMVFLVGAISYNVARSVLLHSPAQNIEFRRSL